MSVITTRDPTVFNPDGTVTITFTVVSNGLTDGVPVDEYRDAIANVPRAIYEGWKVADIDALMAGRWNDHLAMQLAQAADPGDPP